MAVNPIQTLTTGHSADVQGKLYSTQISVFQKGYSKFGDVVNRLNADTLFGWRV